MAEGSFPTTSCLLHDRITSVRNELKVGAHHPRKHTIPTRLGVYAEPAMQRSSITVLTGMLAITLLAASPHVATAQTTASRDGTNRFRPADTTTRSSKVPDRKFSMPLLFPENIPGLGTLYVDPTTLPAGPFLAYDHRGMLVSSVYMIPLRDLNAHKAFNDLKIAQERVDHVDIIYNAGHPGVAEPHYHIVVWYVSPQRVAALEK